jgi:hypothetical protein
LNPNEKSVTTKAHEAKKPVKHPFGELVESRPAT